MPFPSPDRLNEIELIAIRTFSELHDGGCQYPHGGKCGCGWNLVEARLEELRGAAAERIHFLRQSTRISYEHDQERINEILSHIEEALAQTDSTGINQILSK